MGEHCKGCLFIEFCAGGRRKACPLLKGDKNDDGKGSVNAGN